MLFEPLVNDSLEQPLLQDEALLSVHSHVDKPVGIYYRHDNCYRCPYTLAGTLDGGDNVTYKVGAKHGWTLALIDSEEEHVPSDAAAVASADMCSVHAPLGDRGVFAMNVTAGGCGLSTMREPTDPMTPLWAAAVLLVVLAVVHGLCSWAVGWFNSRNKRDGASDGEGGDLDGRLEAKTRKRNRMLSVDTFRGLTILLMIFVNDWQGQYWFFEHAVWNGLLVADLVFPWFLWIMGFCIPLSLASQIKRGKSTRRITYHIFKRAFWLFAIGIILNSLGGKNNLDTYRIPGVLQRFAVCYLVVAVITLPAMLRSPSAVGDEDTGWRRWFAEISNMLPQWLVSIGLLIGHTVIVFGLPVPGCPTGYLGPGGLYDGGEVPGKCVGGATGYIDRLLLGEKHLYQHPTAKDVYQSEAFDPEGLLGALTSCFTVFLGVNAGMIAFLHRGSSRRLIKWTTWGTLCGLIGAILCLGSQEGGIIPINKNLWSISFVLVTSCFAYFVLSFLYVFVDVFKWWSGSPFIYPGRNALAMYVGHMVAYNMFPFHWQYSKMDGYSWRLAEKLWGVACWIIVAIWMNSKGYFWKL